MKPQPLALSDNQMAQVLRACVPLPPDERGQFLERVAAMLQALPEIDDGIVYRVCAEVQQRHLVPPDVFERRVPLVQPRTRHR